ncbi:hypothetical protein IMZ48_03625, partial [Candidatus Bathyarchaeota archaeon]|nr:hypothetical protein [Candidatus Bathyarchaeota archaeon]
FPSVQPILDILEKVSVPSEPMQLPTSLLISCLASIPFYDQSRKNASYPVSSVDKLVDIVDLALKAYAGKASEMNLLTPIVALLHLAQAVDTDSPAQKRLQERLIASEEDRNEVLGKGTTLPHRILKLASNSVSPELREPIHSILFELSGKDPKMFVHNVGFGNAAGFLTTKGINVSQEDIGADDTAADEAPVNPITGQRIDMEAEAELPEMTMEEKEREAERLFVLFERLVLRPMRWGIPYAMRSTNLTLTISQAEGDGRGQHREPRRARRHHAGRGGDRVQRRREEVSVAGWQSSRVRGLEG